MPLKNEIRVGETGWSMRFSSMPAESKDVLKIKEGRSKESTFRVEYSKNRGGLTGDNKIVIGRIEYRG